MEVTPHCFSHKDLARGMDFCGVLCCAGVGRGEVGKVKQFFLPLHSNFSHFFVSLRSIASHLRSGTLVQVLSSVKGCDIRVSVGK